MKTAEQIYDVLSDAFPATMTRNKVIEAMKAYGQERAEQALKDASERVRLKYVGEGETVVDKQSILETPIILL